MIDLDLVTDLRIDLVIDVSLTAISGHEPGSVPSNGTLEPMAQQIPPTQLWGDTFLIVPFSVAPIHQFADMPICLYFIIHIAYMQIRSDIVCVKYIVVFI